MQGMNSTAYAQSPSFSRVQVDSGSPPCQCGSKKTTILGKRKSSDRKTDDYCLVGNTELKKRKIIPKKSELGSIGNGLAVKHSSLPGSRNGVFVCNDVNIGEYITWYDGEVLDVSSVDRKKLLTDYGYWSHLISVDQYTLIQGIKKTPSETGIGLGSLINDGPISGIPGNVEYVKLPDRKAVYIRSKRFIKKGEEVFISYGKSYWDRFQKQFPEEYERLHIRKKRVRQPTFKKLTQHT